MRVIKVNERINKSKSKVILDNFEHERQYCEK